MFSSTCVVSTTASAPYRFRSSTAPRPMALLLLTTLFVGAAAKNCNTRCERKFGVLASGYVMGTAPFCGGSPEDCSVKTASGHGYSAEGGYNGASGGVSYNSKHAYKDMRNKVVPFGQSKAYDDGGSDCWTGTKQCCCVVGLTSSRLFEVGDVVAGTGGGSPRHIAVITVAAGAALSAFVALAVVTRVFLRRAAEQRSESVALVELRASAHE